MSDYLKKRLRITWLILGLFALNVGLHTGLAIASENFWLHPTLAIFAFFATAVLLFTAFVASK